MPVGALIPINNILAFMSQENDYTAEEFETTEEEVEETEDTTEDTEDTEEETTEDNDDDSIDWKARALKAEEAIVKSKKKSKQKPKKSSTDDEEPELQDRLSKVETNQQKWDFGVKHNLTPTVVDEVYKTLGRLPSDQDLKSPAIKGAIEAVKKAERVKNNTPSGGSGDSTLINKDFSKLTKAEKQKNFEKYAKKFQK